MKVAIIGAGGKQGSLIAEELIARGHEVIGFELSADRIQNPKVKPVEKSIFTITSADLKDYDVVVDAFGQFAPGLGFQHQTSMLTLINALKELPNVRLLVVGGAASLFTDETKEHRVLETIPEKFREVPSNMFEAFKTLQESNVNWTYFSPAGVFDFKGEKTGDYILGDDIAIKNEDGESYITYADYSVAMVDEIENPKHIGKRFTAVSRRHIKAEEPKPAEAAAPVAEGEGKEFPDVQFEGNSKYRGPAVTELAGQSFHLVLDDGKEGAVTFLTGDLVTWTPIGGSPRLEKYDCLKVDEDTYFVSTELSNFHPRTAIILVLDLEQKLVTVMYSRQEVDALHPDKVVNDFTFGAIKEAGKDLPKYRHGFTEDLMGARISWTYSDGFAVPHVYYAARYMRAGMPRNVEMDPKRAEAMKKNPYDVTCSYVKIKKYIYLVSFIEDFTVSRGTVGSSLTLLMDISRLHDVGRSYGTWAGKWENYLFSALGRWEETTEEEISKESPYRI